MVIPLTFSRLASSRFLIHAVIRASLESYGTNALCLRHNLQTVI